MIEDTREAAAEIADVIEDTREAIVDEAPSVAETAGIENATADVPDAITTIYGTFNKVGEFGFHPTLKEAVSFAKDRAEDTGIDVPVYRMILVGKTRTTVAFVAEEANA